MRPVAPAVGSFSPRLRQGHHRAVKPPNLSRCGKSNGTGISQFSKIAATLWPTILKRDKGSVLPKAAHSRKTAPGNAVRKVEKVCCKIRKYAVSGLDSGISPKSGRFLVCFLVCWGLKCRSRPFLPENIGLAA